MININDLVVPMKGTGKYLNVRVLPFDLAPTTGITLYWAIHEEGTDTQIIDEVETEVTVPGGKLLEGNLHYPQSEYDNWGTDDSVVTDWAMTELGVTEASAE
jgi:hypothetical protein